MNRRTFLKTSGAVSLSAYMATANSGGPTILRLRRGRSGWPSKASQALNDAFGCNWIPVRWPDQRICCRFRTGTDCKTLWGAWAPYATSATIPDSPNAISGSTFWNTEASVWDRCQKYPGHRRAVDFAHETICACDKAGGGHSCSGAHRTRHDSLLGWYVSSKRDATVQENFVPSGCKSAPQRAVTVGSGTIWNQAYDAVCQMPAGGSGAAVCTTVGVASGIQSGKFSSFPACSVGAAGLFGSQSRYPTAKFRSQMLAQFGYSSDLLKGGGGGTFRAISKLTLRVRIIARTGQRRRFSVKASSDDAHRQQSPVAQLAFTRAALRRTLGRPSDLLTRQQARDQHGSSWPDGRPIAKDGGNCEQIVVGNSPAVPQSSLLQKSAACAPGDSGTWTGAKNITLDVFKADSRNCAVRINVWWKATPGSDRLGRCGLESL